MTTTSWQARRLARTFAVALIAALPVFGIPASAQSPTPAPSSAVPAVPATSPVPPPTPSPAQTAPAVSDAVLLPLDLIRKVDAVIPELERLDKAVERVKLSDDGLALQRAEIEALRTAAGGVRQGFLAPLTAIDEQLRKLGPRPKPPAPPEAPAIEAERARLEAARSRLDAAIKTLDLTDERARQLIGRLQSYRHAIMSRDLLLRSPSPMLPSVWREVANVLPRAAHQIVTILSGWSALLASNPVSIALLLLTAGFVQLVLARERNRRLAVWLPEPPAQDPGTLRRVATGTLAAALEIAPPTVALLILFGGFRLLGLTNQLVEALLDAGLLAVLVFALTRLLAFATLMPRHPSWRALAVTTPSARRLNWLVGAIGVVLALDIMLDALVRMLYLPLAVGVVRAHLANSAIAVLLVAISWTGRHVHADGTGKDSTAVNAIGWLRLPVLALAVGIVAISIAGYVGLASFIARQALLIATGAIALLLVHLTARGSLGGIAAPAVGPNDGNESSAHFLNGTRRSQLAIIGQVLATVVAASVVVCLLLLSWGFSSADIASWTTALLFGFKVGDYTISLWRIVVAGVLFAGLLVATRVLQRWLAGTLLLPQRMDAGIAHSIETGIGYVGTLLAALVGLSYAGLDITNLAIVAGALSVGIGFGLQSIVNNFVSGLILLVERPIKVGDWIVVGEHQGYVRRISVRATEIETFDRASVIVPNSQLIIGAVQNWTLRNAMGRLTIKVGAAYSADPERVMQAIRTALDGCGTLLKYPAPRVTFADFGAHSLDFTVHAFVADVAKGLDAQTEVRLAIFKEFRMAGIEMPFPQMDVHMRDLDAVKLLVARLAEERMRKAMQEAPPAGSTASPT